MQGTRWAATGASSRRSVRVRLAAADAAGWGVALFAALVLRFNFAPSGAALVDAATILPVAVCAQWVIGYVFGIYRSRWRVGSIDEVPALAATVALVAAMLILVDVNAGGQDRLIPLSVGVAAGFMALVFMGAVRTMVPTGRRPPPPTSGRRTGRVIVFGAGSGGERALESMLQDPDSPYVPVALLDDDPAKVGLSIRGVRVVGDRDTLQDAAELRNATVLLVAVPTADGSLIRDLARRADAAGLQVRALPSVRELLGGEVRVVDMREPTDADVLGRRRIETELEAVCEYLTGKVVVITGAGGSIGSELCRQVAAFAPGEMVMIDRDESALHAVQMSLEGRALLDSDGLVLVDIRDRARLARLFAERQPDVVFHAAALKHLPLLKSHPVEALKTNVWGTRAVLDAAAEAGVQRFVNISTDKAANPSSVLGYSKRVCEGLTAYAADAYDRMFLSVRFGNVLRSRGSVLTAFRAQIKAGGPITVTDPDVTRYFMTVEEAVELVLQAGAIGAAGDALVLDMGAQVRIANVARAASRTRRTLRSASSTPDSGRERSSRRSCTPTRRSSSPPTIRSSPPCTCRPCLPSSSPTWTRARTAPRSPPCCAN